MTVQGSNSRSRDRLLHAPGTAPARPGAGQQLHGMEIGAAGKKAGGRRSAGRRQRETWRSIVPVSAAPRRSSRCLHEATAGVTASTAPLRARSRRRSNNFITRPRHRDKRRTGTPTASKCSSKDESARPKKAGSCSSAMRRRPARDPADTTCTGKAVTSSRVLDEGDGGGRLQHHRQPKATSRRRSTTSLRT